MAGFRKTWRSLFILVLAGSIWGVASAEAATVTWSGAGANSGWGTIANWSSGSVPATTDDLVFGSGITSGAAIDFGGSGASQTADSLTFSTTSGFTIGADGFGNQTLTLGANGAAFSLTSNLIATQTAQINANLLLTGVNNWQLNSATTGGTLNVEGNISGASAINVTSSSASGTETLALFDATNSYSGSWTFTGNSGGGTFSIAPQATGVFGSGTLNFRGASNLNFLVLNPVSGTNETISNNIDFTGDTSFTYFNSNNDTIQLTGDLSGAFGTGGRFVFNTNSGGTAFNAVWVIGGSGSSSTLNIAGMQLGGGTLELARTGALGPVVSAFTLGNNATAQTGATNPTLLWEVGETNNLMSVTARSSNGLVTIGEGASSSILTFGSSTKIALQTSSTAADGSNLNLIAAAGSAFNMNGKLTDNVSGLHYNRGVVIGSSGNTGVVALGGSANDYSGGTVVGGGATLLATNTTSTSSATGTGFVQVGYGSGSVTGASTASGSTVVTVASSSGLFLGQAISGTGIPSGSVITAIISGTQIQISQTATATSSGLTLAASAGTGILGGGGYIAPSGTNGITVASGSSVFPGAGGSATAILVLNGGSTSANLLTMQSGSNFTFNLGASNTSDEISLWNYVAGDLTLNGNVINFNNVQAGTYTLFQFYSDSGTTLTADGIASGLVLGSGLNGYTATLNYDADDVSLTLAVPEPKTWILALMGLGLLLGLNRPSRMRLHRAE